MVGLKSFLISFTGILFILIVGCSATTTPKGGLGAYISDTKVISLIDAAENGDAGKVKHLVNSGVNINYIGKEGWTPLLWLMSSKNHDGIRLLLDSGANPNLVTWDDNSAVTFAAGGSEVDLHTLRLLLESGGDPDAFGYNGETALILAIKRRQWRHMDLLLKYGADINKQNKHNTSMPLSAAALEGQYEKVYYLLEKGADYKKKNRFGYSLAHLMNYPIGDASPWKKRVQGWLENKGITFPVPTPIKKEGI